MQRLKSIVALITSGTAFVIVFLDQLSKWFMLAHPTLLKNGGFFELFLTTNEGIAFSIPLKGIILYLVLIVVVGIGIYFAKAHIKMDHPLTGIVAGMIAGGGIGNLIDRFRFGHVIDFIKIGPWPLFNISDSAITCAIVILLIWRNKILKGT